MAAGETAVEEAGKSIGDRYSNRTAVGRKFSPKRFNWKSSRRVREREIFSRHDDAKNFASVLILVCPLRSPKNIDGVEIRANP